MKGKITNYYVRDTKTGNKQVVVEFHMEDGNTLIWTGSTNMRESSDPNEITWAQLFEHAGFNGDINALAQGFGFGALNEKDMIDCYVVDELMSDGTYQKKVKSLGPPQVKKVDGSEIKIDKTKLDALFSKYGKKKDFDADIPF